MGVPLIGRYPAPGALDRSRGRPKQLRHVQVRMGRERTIFVLVRLVPADEGCGSALLRLHDEFALHATVMNATHLRAFEFIGTRLLGNEFEHLILALLNPTVVLWVVKDEPRC